MYKSMRYRVMVVVESVHLPEASARGGAGRGGAAWRGGHLAYVRRVLHGHTVSEGRNDKQGSKQVTTLAACWVV